MPKIPEMSVSGRMITLKTVRILRTSFCRCEITDSFVLSSASTTSLFLRQEALDAPLEQS